MKETKGKKTKINRGELSRLAMLLIHDKSSDELKTLLVRMKNEGSNLLTDSGFFITNEDWAYLVRDVEEYYCRLIAKEERSIEKPQITLGNEQLELTKKRKRIKNEIFVSKGKLTGPKNRQYKGKVVPRTKSKRIADKKKKIEHPDSNYSKIEKNKLRRVGKKPFEK